MILLSFLPFYFAMFTANVSSEGRIWRGITITILLILSFILALSGVMASFLSFSAETLPPEITLPENTLILGGMLILTAMVGLLLLVPTVRQAAITSLRFDLQADNTVHTVALVLAVWLIGLTLSQFLLLQGLSLETVETLFDAQSLSLADVWEQGVAFVLFAILGVGLGLRRDTKATLSRLGVERLTLRQLGLVVGVIVALLLWDAALSWVWELLAPGSYDRISTISGNLLSDLLTPLGALSIGLSAGIGEELLFRGAVQPRFGLLFATILFTVGHVQYEFSPALLSVFIIGLVLGIIRQRENTTVCILIHAGYNTLVVLLAMAGV